MTYPEFFGESDFSRGCREGTVPPYWSIGPGGDQLAKLPVGSFNELVL